MAKGKTIAYKGFGMDMKCRGFQYEVGKEYRHKDSIKMCAAGFHACPSPLDAFSYYPPGNNQYAIVEQSGKTIKDGDKTVSSELKIISKLTIFDLTKAHIEWVKKGIKTEAKENGDQSAASNTGYQSAASNTGYQSAASVSGPESVAMAIGYESKAKACNGSWIVLTERDDDYSIISVKTAKAGIDIEPDVYYMLINGEFIAEDQS